MKYSLLTLFLVLGSACAAFTPAVKPLPPAASRNPALEREALRWVGNSGINADPIYARVVSGFTVEQNELTGAPTKRYVEIVVVVRSRALENTCTWGTHRFYQSHAGGGSYEDTLHEGIVIENGSIDCNSPELKAEPASAPAAGPSPAAAAATPGAVTLAQPGGPSTAEEEQAIAKELAALDPKTPPECKQFAERSCRNPGLPAGSRAAMCKGYVQTVQSLVTQAGAQATESCKSMLGGTTSP
jgi:hypothetical protein